MFRRINKQLIGSVLRSLRDLPKQAARAFVRWLFDSGQRGRQPLGFVLPTAALLVVIIGIFSGALLFQSFERTAEVVGVREKARIDSIALPAVDRARAKLEALFRDPRLPNGIPSERFLFAMLENTDEEDPANFVDIDVDGDGDGDDVLVLEDANGNDPFTLPDETRVNLDGDDTPPDNVWVFQSDLDNDGNNETIVYSINLLSQNLDGSVSLASDSLVGERVANFVTRTGPANAAGFAAAGAAAANCPVPTLAPAQGWVPLGTGRFRKNFQVNVLVENGSLTNPTVSAFEFQQDREVTQGNAFGVWFRYDLLIHPGPQFNLNGAVHTDGNLVTWNDDVRFYLVSAPNSCIYTSEANVITLAETNGLNAAGQEVPTFQGQFITLNSGSPGERLDVFPQDGGAPTGETENIALTEDTDSVNVEIAANNIDMTAFNFLLDPVRLYTRNQLVSRGNNPETEELLTPLEGGEPIRAYDTSVRDPNFDDSGAVSSRITNDVEIRPFVDDTYRADDRWGPQPTYGRNGNIQVPDGEGGALITVDNVPGDADIGELLIIDAPVGDPEEVGLDGYWERRSFSQGARLIVGQRLELGNRFGWLFDGDGDGDFDNQVGGVSNIASGSAPDRNYGDDPLNPPQSTFTPPSDDGMDMRPNEYRQQRTLRDNLAAAQAAVFYHLSYDTDGSGGPDRDFPVACLAMTAHPGTLTTVNNSTTFNTITPGGAGAGNTYIDVDFLAGVGTNGWEFAPPGNVTNQAALANLVENANNPLRIALDNLASFSGDPLGAFPPTQDAAGPNALVHPYPEGTIWGNFSNLRRALGVIDNTTGLQDLSIADQSTIHTASCLLGMLAYGLDEKEQSFDNILNLDGNNSTISADIQTLATGLRNLVNNGCGSGLLFDPALYGAAPCAAGRSVFTPADAAVFVDTDTTSPCTNGGVDGPGFTPFCDEPDVIRTAITTQGILTVLGNVGAAIPASLDTPAEIDAIATLIQDVSQVERDRTFGFERGVESLDLTLLNAAANSDGATDIVFNNVADGLFAAPNGLSGDFNVNLYSACDPDIFGQAQTAGPMAGNRNRSRAGLAVLFCRGGSTNPSYPALYYVFPKAAHAQNGALAPAVVTAGGTEALQTSDPYATDPIVLSGNAAVTYQVAGDATAAGGDNDGFEDLGESSFAALRLEPRTPSSTCASGTGWCLPYRNAFVASPVPPGPLGLTGGTSVSADNQIMFDGASLFPVFLDKGMMNGRQLMAVRVTNIDLDILRDNYTGGTTEPTNSSPGNDGESWLPNSGLIYAFREDAIREDAIARPAAEIFENCREESDLVSGGQDDTNLCRMDPRVPRDPPIDNVTGISPKPVDYLADPDRRPHGFRLANGTQLGREETVAGLSFISDNPVYILGNFNDHGIEEFTDTLNTNGSGDYTNFYDRPTLALDFARADIDSPDTLDRWRPTEVLSDAITILSVSYCDGTIEAGLRQTNANAIDGETCNDNSFRNTNIQGRPSNNATFLLEDGTQSEANTNNVPSAAPIAVDRNGVMRYDLNDSDGDGTDDAVFSLVNYGSRNDDNLNNNGDYTNFTQGRPLNNATPTRVSSVIVSGLSPTRINETYGGLHNFPRFNEIWGDSVALNIDGSLIQLNFSTYDTANLDQRDTFDIDNADGVVATDGANFPFYAPPNRLWGYDPALQYVPAAPVVERLLVTGSPRSEVFQRVDFSDPYIQALCPAFPAGTAPQACP